MKKLATAVLAFILLLISIIPMAGCDLFDDIFAPSDDEDADNKLESFVGCLQNEDREGIKSLFSMNKITELADFDESIEELLVMPFAPRIVAQATFGGERVRYADSPCGASAYARTKKLPFQRQFRDRGGTLPWCRRDSEPPRAELLQNSGGEENQKQSRRFAAATVGFS